MIKKFYAHVTWYLPKEISKIIQRTRQDKHAIYAQILYDAIANKLDDYEASFIANPLTHTNSNYLKSGKYHSFINQFHPCELRDYYYTGHHDIYN